MITKEEERAFLLYVKDEFKRKTGASFGAFKGNSKERDRIVGMIARTKPASLIELKNFFTMQFYSWSKWPAHSRDNMIGFIFKDASFILWRAQQSKSIAGKTSSWDDV